MADADFYRALVKVKSVPKTEPLIIQDPKAQMEIPSLGLVKSGDERGSSDIGIVIVDQFVNMSQQLVGNVLNTVLNAKFNQVKTKIIGSIAGLV